MILLITVLLLFGSVHGFSLPTNSADQSIRPKTFIELTKPQDDTTVVLDRLPASFIMDWPTWVLEKDGTLSRIPDMETNQGFVTPTSIDELWQPIDLKRPQMSLAVGLHIRSGVIRHVMPALDISYDGKHRNRGMNSVPRASTWMDIGALGLLEEWHNFQLQVLSRKQGEDEETWEQLSFSSGKSISQAVERAILFLAEKAPDELGEGSHILHVTVEDAEILETPTSSYDLRATLDYAISDVQETGGEPGVLQVAVSATMAGSESQYLPDVYKSLYADESLHNSLYAEYKKRREEE